MTPRVLVLDDDANILSAFEEFFKREHCLMTAATTAEEALKEVEDHDFDLLVTDVRLPSRSGVSFFLQAKAIHPNLPIIVVTGFPETLDDHQVRSLGANYLLMKPLELEKLRDAVRACLKRD